MTIVSNQTLARAKLYLVVVSLLSLLWLLLFVYSQPAWIQNIKEISGISPVLQASDDSFYNGRIDPIFEKYCVACHDHNKAKGDLRLDSFRQLSFSGKSGADLRAEQNNLLLERMTLPATDRLAMPPYGRLRHSEAELELIQLWLQKGGSGTATEADFPDAPVKAKVINFKDIDWDQIAQQRAPQQAAVQALQVKFPHAVNYLARTSHLLSVDLSHSEAHVDDQMLASFEPVADLISELNLQRSAISDAAINTIKTMTTLERINLVNTQISAVSLEQLASMPKLKKVVIHTELLSDKLRQLFATAGITVIAVEKY